MPRHVEFSESKIWQHTSTINILDCELLTLDPEFTTLYLAKRIIIWEPHEIRLNNFYDFMCSLEVIYNENRLNKLWDLADEMGIRYELSLALEICHLLFDFELNRFRHIYSKTLYYSRPFLKSSYKILLRKPTEKRWNNLYRLFQTAIFELSQNKFPYLTMRSFIRYGQKFIKNKI